MKNECHSAHTAFRLFLRNRSVIEDFQNEVWAAGHCYYFTVIVFEQYFINYAFSDRSIKISYIKYPVDNGIK